MSENDYNNFKSCKKKNCGFVFLQPGTPGVPGSPGVPGGPGGPAGPSLPSRPSRPVINEHHCY